MSELVNVETHKVVVVIAGTAMGFKSIHSAIRFIEEVNCGEESVKLFNSIATAMSDDKEDDGFQIYDVETFADLFMDDDEDDV